MQKNKLLAGILMLLFFAVPQLSYADWSIGVGVADHHDDRVRHDDRAHRDEHVSYRWHEHPHYGLHMRFLPAGYFTIWVGGSRYYYYDGLYYSYVGNGDYILVNPPVGAYVRVIPPDFRPVIINGRTYYEDNGVYYVLEHHGYRVVPQPVVYAPPVQVVVAQPAAVAMEARDTFPVNVPNDRGGFTTVMIKKSGNGFVGPQGEFYAEFPKVSQLKAMYGR